MAAKKLPHATLGHIMMGKSATVAMHNPMVKFERVISRLRQQQPVPIPIDEIVEAVFPDWLIRLKPRTRDGIISTHDRNALAVCKLDAGDFPFHVQLANRGRFWVRAAVMHSAYLGVHGEAPLTMARGRTYDIMVQWWQEASAVQRDIDAAQRLLESIVRLNANPVVLYREWPQLQSILHLGSGRRGAFTRDGEALNVLRGITPQRRDWLERLYATALMLPDTRIDVWVGHYYAQGEE